MNSIALNMLLLGGVPANSVYVVGKYQTRPELQAAYERELFKLNERQEAVKALFEKKAFQRNASVSST